MKFKNIIFAIGIMSFLCNSVLALTHNEIVAFKQGKESIQQKNKAVYQKSLSQLSGTSVAPYLQYYYVQTNLKNLPDSEILNFIRNNPNALFTSSLTQDFYNHKLNEKNYTFIIDHLKDTTSSYLKCIYDAAVLATEPTKFDAARFESYWLKVTTPYSVCNAAENALLKGHIAQATLDGKIDALMKALQIARVKKLLPYLNDEKRTYYQSMINVIENPISNLMSQKKYYKDSSIYYSAAVKAWGRADSTNALKGLDFIQKNKLITESDYISVRNLLTVFQAGRADAISPLSRIEAIPTNEQNDAIKIAGFKLNAKVGNCSKALSFLNRLSAEAQKESTWVYWQARMNQCVGSSDKAKELLGTIATQINFYGFLAADQLNRPYAVLESIVNRKTDQPETLTNQSFKLGLDLMKVGESSFAHQAWRQGIRNSNQTQKNAASFIAYDLGYFDMGITAGVAAQQPGALHIRYPMGYQQEVTQAKKMYGYPEEMLWGLIRQESLFQPDVKSHANAYGLMQLLIPTAEKMARNLGEKRGSLYNPVYNIRYGTAYLNDVSGIVGNVWPYMLASYNAGPHKVKQWAETPLEDIVLWIESIPYYETRGYVKSILENAVIYHYQNGYKARVSEYLK